MPGKRLDESKRECVRKLHEYFQKELANGGPLLPLNAIQEILAVMSVLVLDVSAISLPATINLSQLTKPDFEKIFQEFEAVITDCDGVLWVDEIPVEGAVEVVNKLKNMGMQVILYTNNSTRNRKEFFTKATQMGFLVEKEDIVTTASLVVTYLKSQEFDRKIYLIGSKDIGGTTDNINHLENIRRSNTLFITYVKGSAMYSGMGFNALAVMPSYPGIAEELEQAGYNHLGIGPDVLQHSIAQTVETFRTDPEVGAVVVGYDEHFCYTKLLKAASYLNKPQCLFIATNLDERCVLNPNIVIPGTGPIVRSIETASQREAVIIGKPHSYLCEALKNQKGINPKKTLLIGDRPNTDIVFGNRCGFTTVLVLSGATDETIFDKKKPIKKSLREYIPDYYLDSLGDLLPLLD